MNWSTLHQHLSSGLLHIITFMIVIDWQRQILPSIILTVEALTIALSEPSQTVPSRITSADIHINDSNSLHTTMSTESLPMYMSTAVHNDTAYRDLSRLFFSPQLSSSSTATSSWSSLSKAASLLPQEGPSTPLPSSTASLPINKSTMESSTSLPAENVNELLSLGLEIRDTRYSTKGPFQSQPVSTSAINNSSKVNNIRYVNRQTLGVMSTIDDDIANSNSNSNSNSNKLFANANLPNNIRTKSDSFGSNATASLLLLRMVTARPRIFRNSNNRHHHEHHWGPFFEEPLNSTHQSLGDNVIQTAHLFTEAILNCRVGMLKDKTVMWVRRTDDKVSLLTVGNVTYSSDPRIRVKFQYPNNWRLLINPTQWTDTGIYMCQVSTHPPRVFTTHLTIIEPPLRLIDEQERDVGDRYYKTGSTIDLQCQVSRKFLQKEKSNILKSLMPLIINETDLSSIFTPSTPSYGFAQDGGLLEKDGKYHEALLPQVENNYNKMFSSTNSIIKSGSATEKQINTLISWAKDDEPLSPTVYKRISMDDKWLTTRISISDATISDSGNYSCSIGRLFTAIVQVQVLTGESPAAVQHSSGHEIQPSNRKWLRIFITINLLRCLLKLSH